jgi:hypothetical protein
MRKRHLEEVGILNDAEVTQTYHDVIRRASGGNPVIVSVASSIVPNVTRNVKKPALDVQMIAKIKVGGFVSLPSSAIVM